VVCAGVIETERHRVTIRSFGHAPLLHIAGARLTGPARVLKSFLDRLGAALGLLLLSPAFFAVAAAIWFADGGPPFFCQTRIGSGGREFRIVKFRTMVIDAEAHKPALMDRNECDGALFKIADDPRTTPIGRVLRRYSIDELPQLINVLRGEMSLVGPRPPLATEVAQYSSDMRRRLLVKPGMTGLWQVSGRSQLSGAQSELLDLRYVENWSLAMDAAILVRTLRAVLTGTGAY
jgi:exopolysaccharide biosynthesis polyprenyl glycosylphosphotransferase